MRGRLISVEGLDGTGKTTVCSALVSRLADQRVKVLQLREPGGTELGEQIRTLLADPSRELSARAELLLFAAARAELVETILEPALSRGTWVILDRFTDSTLAYQGAGRRLGDEVARAANLLATSGLQPDRTLLLQAPATIRSERLRQRGEAADRLEQAGPAMFARTAERYDALVLEEPARVRGIDATGESSLVIERAWVAITDLLPQATAD